MYFSWRSTGVSVLLLAAATGVAYVLRQLNIGDQNIIMIYILAVLGISRLTRGYAYGIVSSLLSVLLFNFFYTEPLYTFNAYAQGYPITFLIMLLVALITSALTARVKTQARLAVRREQRTETLYEINRKLLATRGTQNIVGLINENIVRLFDRSVVFYTDPDSPEDGAWRQAEGETANYLLREDEKAVAHWSYVNQKPAGTGTDTLMGARGFYMPVVSQGRALGVIGLSCEKGKLSQNSKYFLQLIVSQVAMALERQALSDAQRKATVASEKEQMRGNLLRAISHDLRTPLTGILGASSTVLENGDTLSRDEKIALLHNIMDDSGWLIRMVENLLSVTRISEGGASLNKSPEAVEEVISEAVGRIRQRFPDANIAVQVPSEVLIVPMDGILIEQVLINLIENAIRHCDAHTPIQVRTQKKDGQVLFEVEDGGGGIAGEDFPHLFEEFAIR
ncbi:MAG: DUF4118 domain-containing protein, partial [Oscillospiraceae bacterium]|nr:DUF4118 domain-containing protein [Oscillospiraceae bacterium]